MFLGERLGDSSEVPGLRDAMVDRLVDRSGEIATRGSQQIRHLRSPASSRIPDAYLADEEIIEDELQTGAAGIWTALALEGFLSDHRQFEADLVPLLAPSARWSLRSEASRVPRPVTRAAALEWSLAPIPWLENRTAWPPAAAVALDGTRQLGETEIELVRATESPYKGWVQLAMFERQGTLATRYPDTPSRTLLITTGLEVCDGPPPAQSLPLSGAPPDAWALTPDQPRGSFGVEDAGTILSVTRGPIAALADYGGQPGVPSHDRGPGLQPFLLVPRVEVIAFLKLRPEVPAVRHALIDDSGPALVCRQWRGFLIHADDYSPLVPGIEGSDLLLRPDLYENLENVVRKERISLGVTVSLSEGALPPM